MATGTPLTAAASPACPVAPSAFLALASSDSLATTDTTMSSACAVAMRRSAPAAGCGNPGCSTLGSGGCCLPPHATLEPGLGLGQECDRECGMNESLDLEKLHSLMDDFDSCGWVGAFENLQWSCTLPIVAHAQLG